MFRVLAWKVHKCWFSFSQEDLLVVPNGYPIPDPNPKYFSIPDPYPINFQNHRVFRVSGIRGNQVFDMNPCALV